MNERSLIQNDLQKLQKYQNSRYKAINAPFRIGFNQKKKSNYRKLAPLAPNSDFTTLSKAQKQIMKDIKQIDNILQNKHQSFKYHNGYLFSQGLSHQLPIHFAQMITVQGQAIEEGFAIWRLHDKEGVINLVSEKLSQSPPNFKDKITDKSLQKIQNYNHQRYEQSLKYGKEPWKYFTKAINTNRALRIKTEGQEQDRNTQIRKKHTSKQRTGQQLHFNRKLTELSNYYNNSSTGTNNLSLLQPINSKSNSQSTPTREQLSFRTNRHQSAVSLTDLTPSKQQLSKMLLKQNNIVSIWIPPSNYAQLLAVFSIQIRQKQVGVRTCWIGKYFCPRHALSRRVFNCFLDWANTQYGFIEELSLKTSKYYFDSVFGNLGWKITSWISDQRMRISYKRSFL